LDQIITKAAQMQQPVFALQWTVPAPECLEAVGALACNQGLKRRLISKLPTKGTLSIIIITSIESPTD